MEEYLKVNQASWNERAKIHFESDFYDNASFIQGRNSLNSIELDILGDISGKSILHLQCHFGQDTISLSRMGADALGIDLSDESIALARKLNDQVGSNTRFVVSDVYSLPDNLQEKFDIVFTSYGTIGWLPDLDKWAKVVSHFLKDGGRFIMADFHPVVWMFKDDFSGIGYSYFKDEVIVEEEGTYTENAENLSQKHYSWNHAMEEILTSLLNEGLVLRQFKEFDYSPYNCFQKTVEIEAGKWQIRGLEGKIPMVYAIEMVCK